MSISYSDSVLFIMSQAMIQDSNNSIEEALSKGHQFGNKRPINLKDDNQSNDKKNQKTDHLHKFSNYTTIVQFISKKKKRARVDGLYHYVLWRENIRALRNQKSLC